MASGGAGFRQLVRESWVAGFYVLADANQSGFGANFWAINPGLEVFNNAWDFHLNGYFPNRNSERLSDSFYGQTSFSGHTQYNNIMQMYNDNGMGGDIIVGHTFASLKNTRIYGAGYHYRFQHISPMSGGQAGLETPLTQYINLVIDNSYDNVNHEQITLGLRFIIGDIPTAQKKSVDDHMMDSIARHMGTLDTGAGTPSRRVVKQIGTEVAQTNIWFFNPSGGSAFSSSSGIQNCTFENPCSGTAFSQATLDSINTLASNANIYVNSGNVNFSGTLITLANGMSLSGRQNNFIDTATDNRPIFNGTLGLAGNNSINDLEVQGSDVTIAGFGTAARAFISATTATGNIYLNNVTGGAISSANGAIAADFRGGNASITNSTLNAESAGGSDMVTTALQGQGNVGTINVDNSTLTAVSSSGAGIAQGVTLSGNAIANITNSTINASNPTGSTAATTISTAGIVIADNSQITLDNSIVNTNQEGGIRNSVGIQASDAAVATINNSVFNIFANQPANSAFGTFISNTAAVTFNNSTITINNSGVSALDGNNASILNNSTATCDGSSC